MTEQNIQSTGLKRAGVFRIITIVLFMALQWGTFYLAAGDITYMPGWIYSSLFLVYFICVMAYIFIRHPEMIELVNERGRFKGDTKWWDKVIMAVYIPTLLVMPIVGGLDAVRYKWSIMPGEWIFAGMALFIGAGLFVQWAMIVNRHFEITVRLQKDRGHAVVSGGPYAYIRHPGYAGMSGLIVSYPLIVGSAWCLLPAGVIVVLLVVRTALEDRMLRAELEGYDEYARKVRYRLVPYLW